MPPSDALAALRWQIELGADEALSDAPQDRLAVSPPSAAARPAAPLVPPAAAALLPVSSATALAAAADTLDALCAAIAGFTGCALSVTATRPVLPTGDPRAGLLLIGEAPSDTDDREGRPFTGPAGAMLDQMLASIGLDRDHLILAPLIPWRPPGGRVPSTAERALGLPFLLRLIALVQPRRVVLLGALAARDFLGAANRRVPRAAWHPLALPDLPPIPALATEDPGFLLRNPGPSRRRAWADLRLLRRTLDEDITKS